MEVDIFGCWGEGRNRFASSSEASERVRSLLLATGYSNNGPIRDRKIFETELSVNGPDEFDGQDPLAVGSTRPREEASTRAGPSVFPLSFSGTFPLLFSPTPGDRSLNPYRSIRIHEGCCSLICALLDLGIHGELSAGISKRGKQGGETRGSDPFLAIVFEVHLVDSSVNLAAFLIPPKRSGFWRAEMDRCDENSRGVVKPASFRVPTVMENRRALRDIRNLEGEPQYGGSISKRGPADKSSIAYKDSTLVARRPITRKFAATLASKSQAFQQHGQVGKENHHKPPVPPQSSSSGLNICNVIYVDDSMVEEMEEMDNSALEDVGMEDIETIPDIDSCDSNNPLAVVEYVQDIYTFYRQTEVSSCVSPDYMTHQFDINEKMRAILIDWLIEVHYKFELMEETLFLTVNIIDRFLARQAVVRKKLQLVGVTAMLLACKYEEVSVPVVEDLVLISDKAYTREEILEMERLIVNTLQFNMSVPTPYVFIKRFLKVVESDEKLELLSFFIVELCLVEYKMLKFCPSLLAAAAIYTAQCSLQGFKCWTKSSEMHTAYTEDQLLECSKLMVDFHLKAGNGKLTGVHRKYSTFKYGWTAKLDAASFLLDTRL